MLPQDYITDYLRNFGHILSLTYLSLKYINKQTNKLKRDEI